MYIITTKDDNRIMATDRRIKYLPNGYPMLIDTNIAFASEIVNVYEVSEVPSEVIPEKYCYTEADGFYINPNYVEPDPTNPYGLPDETVNQIIDDYTLSLIEGGVL